MSKPIVGPRRRTGTPHVSQAPQGEARSSGDNAARDRCLIDPDRRAGSLRVSVVGSGVSTA
jgi:hypothetical protein